MTVSEQWKSNKRAIEEQWESNERAYLRVVVEQWHHEFLIFGVPKELQRMQQNPRKPKRNTEFLLALATLFPKFFHYSPMNPILVFH